MSDNLKEFTKFTKKAVSYGKPWTADIDPGSYSLSLEDEKAGSPKEGDYIFINPANPEDMWLVSAEYLAANYQETGQ